MRIGIDKGHRLGTGASKILNETTENRKIGNELIRMLKEKGHTVVDCTSELSNVDSQLAEIARKANAQELDVFCSIHLNAGGGSGTETFIWNGSWSGKEANRAIAKKVNDAVVASCSFRNRGVKEANYYVLRATKAPAILVEVCFVDSIEDSNKLDCVKVAKAIFKGLTGVEYVEDKPVSTIYRIRKSWSDARSQIGAYSNLENAKKNCPQGYFVFDANGKVVYPTATIPSKGKCTITEKSGIIFRNKPCTATGVKQGTYEYGESVNYDSTYDTNGYIWISWIGASTGTRRYMPIIDKSTNEVWGKCV